MKCRHCLNALADTVLDLGHSPLSNGYLHDSDLSLPEIYFPLKVMVCTHCWLVQTADYVEVSEVFTPEYAYFSSVSQSWMKHAQDYVEMITNRLKLNQSSQVVEIASNDGYLLRNFNRLHIPNIGIEPTRSTADAAIAHGVDTIVEFFGTELAQTLVAEGYSADLIIGNNVYAHVPKINDFTQGISVLLKPTGVVTLEFPHVYQLLERNQFDTVYHEHYSYLSLLAVQKIFNTFGMRIFDVEELPTHGGSLRIYGCLQDADHQEQPNVGNTLSLEIEAGLNDLAAYQHLQSQAESAKDELLLFLLNEKRNGRRVCGYGAAAKGNTLLNFAGVKTDLIEFVVDGAISKQGKYLPGSHIPIHSPDHFTTESCDSVVIFPWNLVDEIRATISRYSIKAHDLYIAIPKLQRV